MSYDIGYISNHEIISNNDNLMSDIKWEQEMKKYQIVENCNYCGWFCKMHGFDFYCRHPKSDAIIYRPKHYEAQLKAKKELFSNCPLDDYPEAV